MGDATNKNMGIFARISHILGKKSVMLISALAALGVLLIIAGGGEANGRAASEGLAVGSGLDFDEAEYARELEKTAESLISELPGVGDVKVALTLGSAHEAVYAKDNDTSSGTERSEYIKLRGADGDEVGLALSVNMPKVRGVAVVCGTGCGVKLKGEITALVTALFALPSNRVYVGPAS